MVHTFSSRPSPRFTSLFGAHLASRRSMLSASSQDAGRSSCSTRLSDTSPDRADVASTEYAEDGWWEPGEKVGDLVAALVERSASIHLLLAAETPDISKLRSAFGALRSRINDLSNELEEGDDE